MNKAISSGNGTNAEKSETAGAFASQNARPTISGKRAPKSAPAPKAASTPKAASAPEAAPKAAPTPKGKTASHGPARNPLPMLGVLYGSAFVAAFNENIMNVALLDIMAEFSVTSITAQWLVTGYMIVTSIVVALMAYLSRRFTVRTLFFSGAALFIAGSLAAIVAPSFPLLLLFRLVQAGGTGIFIPMMMNTVLACAPRNKLGAFLSIGSCCITLGPAFGPVVAGVMVTFVGWRSVFLPSCAIMVILLVLGTSFVRNLGEAERPRLDVPSLALAALGLTALSFGLTQVTSNVAYAACGIIGGVALVVLFGWRQKRISNPLMDIGPVGNPRFSLACVLAVIAMMTTFSLSVLLPLYFQGALLLSALVSGALILIPIIFNSATALVAGRIMDKWGTYPLLPAGFALIAVGQAAICLAGRTQELILVTAAAVVVYAGVGLVFSPSQTAGLKCLTPKEHPHGVAIMSTFVQIAGCLGPSLFVGIMSTSAAQAQAEGLAATTAQATGFSATVAVACVIAVIGCAVALPYARKAHKEARLGAQAKATAATRKNEQTKAAGATTGKNEQDVYAERTGAAAPALATAKVTRAASEAHVARGEARAACAMEAAGGVSTSASAEARAASAAAATAAACAVPQAHSTSGSGDSDGDDTKAALRENAVDAFMKREAYSIGCEATIMDTMRALIAYETSGLPVVDDAGFVRGFISNGDIIKALGNQKSIADDLSFCYSAKASDAPFDERLRLVMAANVMDYAATRVVSVDAESSIEEVCTKLGEKRIKKLPVMREGKLVGTISRADVVRYLMGELIEQ